MNITREKLKTLIIGVLTKSLANFIIDECDDFPFITFHSKLSELYERVCAINRMKAKRGHYIWDDIDKDMFVKIAYQVAVELVEPNHLIIFDNTER